MYADSISREAIDAAIYELGGKVTNTPDGINQFTIALHKQFAARGVTFKTDEECIDLAQHLAELTMRSSGLVERMRAKGKL